jgi:hypothetical protein
MNYFRDVSALHEVLRVLYENAPSETRRDKLYRLGCLVSEIRVEQQKRSDPASLLIVQDRLRCRSTTADSSCGELSHF